MTVLQRSSVKADDGGVPRARLRRFVPVVLILLAMIAVFATGAHRHVSLETLVKHRMTIDAFIGAHAIAAGAAYMAIYIIVVALSIPGSLFLTITGGILFGVLVGGIATVISATIGATIIFLIAKGACGESLVRRAGPLACKLVEGFKADAFNYLLFLRLVPAFPFFLVNLVPALVGVKLPTFVAATFIGIIPAVFAFTFLGSGLDSVIAVQEGIYRACLAAGRTDCQIHFNIGMIATPRLLASLATLGVIALIPVIVKRLRARSGRSRTAALS
ncbi:MAG: TVP38/TMEM64 family protein [Alphaproteobacteria bacterium]|nr:MAG: TVP38/TMEM64 family protein [Alphaproteobacteria bacterium]